MGKPKTHSVIKPKRIISSDRPGVTPLLIVGHDQIKDLQETGGKIVSPDLLFWSNFLVVLIVYSSAVTIRHCTERGETLPLIPVQCRQQRAAGLTEQLPHKATSGGGDPRQSSGRNPHSERPPAATRRANTPVCV